jgi:hypothetical protein
MTISSDNSPAIQHPDKRILRILLLVFFVSGLWIVYQLFSYSPGLEAFGSSSRWTVILGGGLLLVLVFALLTALTWTRFGDSLLKFFSNLMGIVGRNHWLAWVNFILSTLIFGWLVLNPYGDFFGSASLRLGLLLPLIAISTLLFKCIWPDRGYWVILLASTIWYASIFEILILLPGISTHPFTLTWSEGSAYYYASLFFSERIYGLKANLPLINPTRHMLLAIPFLFGNLPIWVHRLWEVMLWLLISGIAIALIVRRLEIQDKFIRWIYIAWVFIYLFQGPVFYFLLISLIPILWGFDPKRFLKTLLLVLIGSVWVGASRVNWIPFPGLFAAVLYFLEEDINHRNWLRYVMRPAIWVALGTITALFVWYGYANISGHPVEQFGVYFTSTMLWYRLLPNATISYGVLLAVLIASVPILGYIALRLYNSGHNYHFIRRYGIGIILLVFFSGGLIVSAKIGGGNNIHNLDAYLLILFAVGSYLYFDKTPSDYSNPIRKTSHRISTVFIVLTLLTPVYFSIQKGRPITYPELAKTENALRIVQESAKQTVDQGGHVLFLGERQLLTFNQVEEVPLIEDYERMFLMEMVMGENEAYLDKFYEQIENQEFALIVSEPLKLVYKGRNVAFGDENDVYVRLVSEPVLCYYEPIKTIRKFAIQLLIPKQESEICSLAFPIVNN